MTPTLETMYLGLRLRNPLVASSSPLTGRLGTLRRLTDAGIGAVVLPSLFEEQIEREEALLEELDSIGQGLSPEASGYLDPFTGVPLGADDYLRHLDTAKATLDVPVIASLNGHHPGAWTGRARDLEAAGADAIELNTHFLATDPTVTAAEVEQRTCDIVHAVTSRVRVPVAVKLGPWFSSLPHLVMRLYEAGAGGVVLFNRFYQPDIDLEELDVVPSLTLSTRDELRLTLRWVAILHGRVPVDLAGSGGVHEAADVVKLLLAGADAVTMASSLLLHGPEHVRTVLDGLSAWLVDNDYDSVSELRGALSQRSAPDPEAFERANYLEALAGYAFGYRIGGEDGMLAGRSAPERAAGGNGHDAVKPTGTAHGKESR